MRVVFVNDRRWGAGMNSAIAGPSWTAAGLAFKFDAVGEVHAKSESTFAGRAPVDLDGPLTDREPRGGSHRRSGEEKEREHACLHRVLRDQLVQDGRLVEAEEADLYRFTTDVAFARPSAAASVVAARSASGPREWKLRRTGQMYRDWRAAKLGQG